jgi:hypothetical protein
MKEIYLDYDLRYDTHLDSIIAARFAARISKIISKYGSVSIFKRKSSSGNTHYKLVFENDISVFDHFIIRAALCDDRDRVYIDLKRYFLNGEQEINRLFDGKVILTLTQVSASDSGNWVPVNLDDMIKAIKFYIKKHIDKGEEKYVQLLRDIP